MVSDLPGTGDTRGCETPNMGVMNGTRVSYKISFQRIPKFYTSQPKSISSLIF